MCPWCVKYSLFTWNTLSAISVRNPLAGRWMLGHLHVPLSQPVLDYACLLTHQFDNITIGMMECTFMILSIYDSWVVFSWKHTRPSCAEKSCNVHASKETRCIVQLNIIKWTAVSTVRALTSFISYSPRVAFHWNVLDSMTMHCHPPCRPLVCCLQAQCAQAQGREPMRPRKLA